MYVLSCGSLVQTDPKNTVLKDVGKDSVLCMELEIPAFARASLRYLGLVGPQVDFTEVPGN
jgi:hypothetical protein